MSHNKHSPELWDSIATQYDGLRPDQSLSDPNIRQHWQELYAGILPAKVCTILDAGCGTGSLGMALAEAGHDVTGIDFSPKMIAEARAKAEQSDAPAGFSVADAVNPNFPPQTFDAVTCRQVLWALPGQQAALQNWSGLLKPHGVMVLIEGLFASGNGMSESEILAILPDSMEHVETRDLSPDPLLWGAPLPDQRFLLIARRRN